MNQLDTIFFVHTREGSLHFYCPLSNHKVDQRLNIYPQYDDTLHFVYHCMAKLDTSKLPLFATSQ